MGVHDDKGAAQATRANGPRRQLALPPPSEVTSKMDLREHRLFDSDISLDCCPTATEHTQRVTAINWHGIIVELLQTENFTHAFYETVCQPEYKDRPCQYVDPKLVAVSRCVQQYNYVYAVGRPFGTDEQYRIELIRVASGCKCRLTAAALKIIDNLPRAESVRLHHPQKQQHANRIEDRGRQRMGSRLATTANHVSLSGSDGVGGYHSSRGRSSRRHQRIDHSSTRRRSHRLSMSESTPVELFQSDDLASNQSSDGHSRLHSPATDRDMKQHQQPPQQRQHPDHSSGIDSLLVQVPAADARIGYESGSGLDVDPGRPDHRSFVQNHEGQLEFDLPSGVGNGVYRVADDDDAVVVDDDDDVDDDVTAISAKTTSHSSPAFDEDDSAEANPVIHQSVEFNDQDLDATAFEDLRPGARRPSARVQNYPLTADTTENVDQTGGDEYQEHGTPFAGTDYDESAARQKELLL